MAITLTRDDLEPLRAAVEKATRPDLDGDDLDSAWSSLVAEALTFSLGTCGLRPSVTFQDGKRVFRDQKTGMIDRTLDDQVVTVALVDPDSRPVASWASWKSDGKPVEETR